MDNPNHKVFLDLKKVPDIDVDNWQCKSKPEDNNSWVCINKKTGVMIELGKDDNIKINASNYRKIINGEKVSLLKNEDNSSQQPKQEVKNEQQKPSGVQESVYF